MAYFNREDRGGNRGNRRSFGGGSSFRGGDRGNRSYGDRDSSDRKEMFKTVCDNCGNSCEVPFRPSGDKPVYCSDCFNEQRQSAPRNDRSERNFDRPESKPVDNRMNEKILEQLADLNLKFGQLLLAMENLSKDRSEFKAEKKAEVAEVQEKKEAKAKKPAKTKKEKVSK